MAFSWLPTHPHLLKSRISWDAVLMFVSSDADAVHRKLPKTLHLHEALGEGSWNGVKDRTQNYYLQSDANMPSQYLRLNFSVASEVSSRVSLARSSTI